MEIKFLHAPVLYAVISGENSILLGILGEKQLGGASADAQSYWQGRFAAYAYVECV